MPQNPTDSAAKAEDEATETTLEHAAADYAASGTRVFPVNADKTPKVATGFKAATTDEKQIRKWWGQWPDAGIGTPTGGGGFVLDVDGAEGANSLADLEREHGQLPATAEVTTPRGRHLYFSASVPVPSVAGKLALGLDIRGDGGYVILPPSRSERGSYRWAAPPQSTPVAKAPSWLIGRVTVGKKNPSGGSGGFGISAGKRNATLATMAGSMLNLGLSSTAIEAALIAHNRELCKPPLPESEVRKIAASIGRYRVVQDGTTRRRAVLTQASTVKPTRLRWLWSDRIAAGKVTGFVGPPKTGKGLTYAWIAAQITHGQLGGDLLGEPRDVIILQSEDDEGDTLVPRLIAAGADLTRVHFLHMTEGDAELPFSIPADVDQLGAAIQQTDAALVIVDPMVEFISEKVDSFKSPAVRRALGALTPVIRETDVGLLSVVHVNKGDGNNPLQRMEGAAAYGQMMRGLLQLGRDPDDPGGDRGNQRVLATAVSNLAEPPPGIVLRIETTFIEADDGQGIAAPRIIPIGISHATAEDLLTTDESRSPGQIEEAEDFLRAQLANGAKPAVKEVEKKASEGGISQATLKRARSNLDVHCGPAKGVQRGPWLMWLNPPEPQESQSTEPHEPDPVDTGDSGGSDVHVVHGPDVSHTNAEGSR